MTLRIANAAGFWGDWPSAPRRLLETAEVDFLTLEYLAELTLSIMASQRKKSPTAGYATDFVTVTEDIVSLLQTQPQLKIVTNAGGLNPISCARAVGKVLVKCGLGNLPIGVVFGDDLLPQMDTLTKEGCELLHFDRGEPLGTLREKVTSANAYLGAEPISRSLEKGARIVITGRVADASLTVGPAVHQFGWTWDDWNSLAAASVAGHIIECGAQATGGYSTDWKSCQLANIGYPIAEIGSDGQFIITKPDGSGGQVTRHTVTEQLVYEIGDPAAYLTPDVIVDFTTVEVAALAENRVAVRGSTGREAPESYKVSLAYADGFTASGQLLVFGKDCVVKAKVVASLIEERLHQDGIELARMHTELLGAGDGLPGMQPPPDDLREVMLRIAAYDPRREAVAAFARQFAPLITNGPAGLAGYAQGRPSVRPLYSYWPTTVPKELVFPEVRVLDANHWANTPENN